MEPFYPLKVWVCDNCYLAQLEEYVSPENIFSEYGYFSSYSDSWLKHAKHYTDLMVDRFNIDKNKMVIELASNDGYLLQYFLEKEIPVHGIEPAKNIAKVAIEKGIPTTTEFFGVKLAKKLARDGIFADLLVGNNILAHVPDINDFVGGMQITLKPHGVITMEFPHLKRLIDGNQFDTIYHEHFSYLSLLAVEKIFKAHKMKVFDVDELDTHGGSLRIYVRHIDDTDKIVTDRVDAIREQEIRAGYTRMETYKRFAEKVKKTKWNLLNLLINKKLKGKKIVGYGAPGKGNTLLNYCGIRDDFLDYTVDRNPYKHGRFTAGTHIEILPPEKILEDRPDYVLILPWNLKNEIMKQLEFISEWGGKFILPIPEAKIVEPC
jgi:hypothetical protein